MPMVRETEPICEPASAVNGEDHKACGNQGTDDAEDRQLSGHQKIRPVTMYTTRNTATIAAMK